MQMVLIFRGESGNRYQVGTSLIVYSAGSHFSTVAGLLPVAPYFRTSTLPGIHDETATSYEAGQWLADYLYHSNQKQKFQIFYM